MRADQTWNNDPSRKVYSALIMIFTQKSFGLPNISDCVALHQDPPIQDNIPCGINRYDRRTYIQNHDAFVKISLLKARLSYKFCEELIQRRATRSVYVCFGRHRMSGYPRDLSISVPPPLIIMYEDDRAREKAQHAVRPSTYWWVSNPLILLLKRYTFNGRQVQGKIKGLLT
jgi:hypothetical protein